MGYCVNMNLNNITISVEKVADALAAINALHKDDKTKIKNGANGGSYAGGERTGLWYSWVNDPEDGGFKSIEEAFKAWRYEAVEEDGGCVVEYFNGEKLGNDDVLWRAVAPFINPKGAIECQGEDGTQWRWVFKDGKFKEQSGKVVWEDA